MAAHCLSRAIAAGLLAAAMVLAVARQGGAREIALEIDRMPWVFDPSTDLADQFGAFEALAGVPDDQSDDVVRLLTRHADDLAPLFLFELARRLWDRDRDLAMEWFAVGRLRTEYDARRCIDPAALRGATRAVFHAENAVADLMRDRAPHDRAALRALTRSDLFAGTASPRWACAQAQQYGAAFGVRARSSIALFRRSFDRPESEWLRSEADWAVIREQIRESGLRDVQQRLRPAADAIAMSADQIRRVDLDWADRPITFGWIDDRQLAVLVERHDDRDALPPQRLHIWRRDGPVVEVARTYGYLCAAGGTISYLVRQELAGADRATHTFRVGRGADWEERSVTLGHFGARSETTRQSPFDCSWVDGEPFLRGQRSIEWLPLRPGDGILLTSRAGVAHVGAAGATPVELPFWSGVISMNGVHYYSFRNAYFIAPPSFHRSNDPTAVQPPCISVWWFYPRDARTEQTCVPTDSINTDSETVLYAATRLGILRATTFRRSPYGHRPAGVYVTRPDGRTEKLVEAYVRALSVSPDGCAVAFAHGEQSSGNLSIIDLCPEARP